MKIGIRTAADQEHPLTFGISFEVNELHGHDFWEITYLSAGEAQNIINGKVYPMKKGAVIVHGPMHAHQYRVRTKSAYEHRDIYIDSQNFEVLCSALGETVYEKFCDAANPACFHIDESLVFSLDNRLRRLQLADPLSPSTEEKSVHRAIVAELLGYYIAEYNLQKNPYPDWLINLLAEMNKTAVVCGSFQNLVELSNYSAGHLSREFKKHMGISLSDYFAGLKMRHALSLIVNTNLPISGIALEIGYGSLSHFIHKFEKIYGMSPRTYRERYKQNKNNAS